MMIWEMIKYLTKDYLAEFALIFCQDIFLAAWRALPLLVIAIIVGMLFRRKLAAKYHAVLWSLVVIRLLMPVSFNSAWSIHGPIRHAMVKLFEDDSPSRDAVPSTTAASPQETTTFRAAGSTYHVDVDQSNSIPAEPPADAGADWASRFIVLIVLAITSCAVVAVGLILRSVLAHVLFARKLARCKAIDDHDTVSMLTRECKSLHIKRVPRLKEVSGLAAPAVFGLVKSTICLPVNFVESVSAYELRWIVRHELAHVARFDTWMMTLASVARSFHWMNPLAWLTVAKLRANMEAAADQIAVGSVSTEDAAAYGRLLIRIAEGANGVRPSAALGLLPFAAKRTLKNRIQRLVRGYGPNRKWIAWTFALSVAIIIAVAFTDESVVQATPEDAKLFGTPMNESVFRVGVNEPEEGEETRLEQHDIAATLEKTRQTPTWSGTTDELVKTLQLMFPASEIRIEENSLLANLTAKQHEKLSTMLRAWETNGPQQISIEFKILETTSAIAAKLEGLRDFGNAAPAPPRTNPAPLDQFGKNVSLSPHVRDNASEPSSENRSARSVSERPLKVPFRRSKDGSPVYAYLIVVNDDELNAISQVALSDSEAKWKFAPKVTLFNGQCVSIADTKEHQFATGAKSKRGDTKEITTKFEIGLKSLILPIIANENSVRMTIDFHKSLIDRSRMVVVNAVEIPGIRTQTFSSTFELAPDETMLIAMPENNSNGKSSNVPMTTLYSITPRVLDLH